jgi:hypothetical protein
MVLAIILAASLATLTAEDVQAASDQLRANNALVASDLEHAAPLLACVTKQMKASPPSKSTDPQKQYREYLEQMSASEGRCGVVKEHEFWAASLKQAYPEWSNELANAVAADSLSFFIFDSTMTGP